MTENRAVTCVWKALLSISVILSFTQEFIWMCIVTEIEGNRVVGCVGSAFLLKRSSYANVQISSSQCDRDTAGLHQCRFNKTVQADLNVIVCQSSDLQLLMPHAFRSFPLTSSGAQCQPPYSYLQHYGCIKGNPFLPSQLSPSTKAR